MQGPFLTSMALTMAVVAVIGTVASTVSPAEAFSSTISTKLLPQTPTKLTRNSATILFVSRFNEGNEKGTKQEGGKESEEDFQRRMAVVRSLQMSFYGKDASKEETAEHGNNKIGNETDDSSSKASSSNSCNGPPELDASTGTISKLPLFRAAWYELPGRSNVLIIRDPIYTNMFERMFYTRNNDVAWSSNMTPWVFGHMYTPKEKENEIDKKSKPRELSSWRETDRGADTSASALSSPSVLGTLMYVRDYRRLKDGRIVALVQAAEKFVVEEVRQSLPYAIADVKVLPDVEELRLEETLGEEPSSSTETVGEDSGEGPSSKLPPSVYFCNEKDEDERSLVDCLRADEGNSAGPARARAVFDSIHSYHYYECDPDQRLDGIPQKSDLSIFDITYDAMSKALPYCRFSNKTETLTNTNEFPTKEIVSPTLPSTTPSPSLELLLLRQEITKIPPSDRRFSYNTEPTYSSNTSEEGENEIVKASRPWTTDELEYELWLVLDYFSEATKKPVSPIILALLPSEGQMPKAWPSGFRLEGMLEEHHRNSPHTISSSSNSVYPNHRRQRRFSFSAAYLLEAILPISEGRSSNNNNNHPEGIYSDNFRNGGRRCAPQSSDKIGTFEVDEIQEFRALLLSVPSTRQRLRVVLETFHRWRLYQECDEFA